MNRPAAYLWGVNVLGTACIVVALVHLVRLPVDPAWLIPAGLAILSGTTVLRMRSVQASFSVGDTFSFAALFLYGPEAATVTVALDTLAISLRLKGPAERIVFNSAAASLAMWTAGTLVFRVAALPFPIHSGSVLLFFVAAVAAVAIYFVLGSGFVAAAVALHQRQSIGRLWRQHFAQLWTGPAAGGYVGALAALFSNRLGLVELIAMLPIPLILYQALRSSLGRVDDEWRHLIEMKRMYHATVEAFATAVDAKDHVTAGHTRRVQAYCAALAREFGIADEATLRALEAAALLHDVGKIGIPEHILNKPGKLTTEEYEVMKGHVAIGTEILSGIVFPFPVVPIVKCHHESWDGTGYPGGLRGEEIPLAARILTVVDCFDAVTSVRPYRGALSTTEAFEILRSRRGTMYDPRVVDAFIALQPQLAATIRQSEPAAEHAPSPGPPASVRSVSAQR
ncbi:MAG TPA: HD-GYP domain-containing protein [Vicinamibacterales bacterium]|nr:HD-GYP domain-containing protein [Vicinamibacterales bacterium]